MNSDANESANQQPQQSNPSQQTNVTQPNANQQQQQQSSSTQQPQQKNVLPNENQNPNETPLEKQKREIRMKYENDMKELELKQQQQQQQSSNDSLIFNQEELNKLPPSDLSKIALEAINANNELKKRISSMEEKAKLGEQVFETERKRKADQITQVQKNMMEVFDNTGLLKDPEQRKKIEAQIQKFVPTNVPTNPAEMKDFSEQLNFTTATVACANTFREKYEQERKKVAELTGKLNEYGQKESSRFISEINRMPQQKSVTMETPVPGNSWNFTAYDDPFSSLTSKFIEPLNKQFQPEVQDNKRQKMEEQKIQNNQPMSTLERMRMQIQSQNF